MRYGNTNSSRSVHLVLRQIIPHQRGCGSDSPSICCHLRNSGRREHTVRSRRLTTRGRSRRELTVMSRMLTTRGRSRSEHNIRSRRLTPPPEATYGVRWSVKI